MKALVTGSTDGIGFATAEKLAAKGYFVLLHGRKEKRCDEAAEKIKSKNPGAILDFIAADLSELKKVEAASEIILKKHPDLNILINNAGVFFSDREITEDGFESTFQINYLSHVLLTLNLTNALIKQGRGRIINVSSMAHAWAKLDFENLNGEKHYSGEEAYAVSKLCNIMFTYKLSRVIAESGVTVNALHPGVINTKLLRKGWGIGGAPVSAGSETSVYLAASEEVENITGKYFVDKKPAASSKISYDKELQEELWNLTLKMLNVKKFPF